MFTKSTGCKQRKFSNENYQLKTLNHVILHFSAISHQDCLYHHCSSPTATQVLNQIHSFMLYLLYSIYDVHLPECFKLWLLFGFEQSSFYYKKAEFNIPIRSIALTTDNQVTKLLLSDAEKRRYNRTYQNE